MNDEMTEFSKHEGILPKLDLKYQEGNKKIQ